MDFDSAVVKFIRNGDIDGLKALCLNEETVNQKLICPTPVPCSRDEFFLPPVTYPTPLVYAILCKQSQVVSYLLQIGAKVKEYPICGWYPIHFAVASKSYEVTREILAVYPDEINTVTNNLSMPIHFAVSADSLQLTTLLIKYGADVNAQNVNGNTPLHLCAHIHDQNIVLALLAVGADCEIHNENDQTPIQYSEIVKKPFLKDIFIKIQNSEIEVPSEEEILHNLELSVLSSTEISNIQMKEDLDILEQRVMALEEAIEFGE